MISNKANKLPPISCDGKYLKGRRNLKVWKNIIHA